MALYYTDPPEGFSRDMTPTSRIKITLTVAAGLFVLAVAFMIIQGQQPTVSSPDTGDKSKSSATAAQQVQTLKVQRRDISRTLTLPANISPWYQATLYGKVSGYVKWIGVDKGDFVKEGQLLAVTEAPEIEDQYKQAQSDYEIKQVTYERYLSVWKENHDIIAKQDVDVAKAAAQSAKHLRDSRKSLLDYTKVYAPFDGIITARFADPGALIQAASTTTQATPLFTIMDMEKVRVYVNVPQESAEWAKAGIPVTLATPELSEEPIESAITRTTEALDPATRTLLVEIDVPNKERRLQPGMFVNASLHLQRHPNALAVPPAAIVPGKNGREKAVFVLSDNTVKLTPVKTGIDDGLLVEILEGLSGDDEIVVVGKSGLADGQTVRASPYNLPSAKPAKQKI